MRTLASGSYTAAQVEAQLRAGHFNFTSRYELLDSTLAVVGELTTVIGATVEYNVDRAIKGALRLVMLPDSRLTQPFQYRIKPWFRIQMPDTGWAEFPLGVFIWNAPERTLPPEVWDVTLGDLGHLLESGPGPGGYTALAGTTVTGQIVEVLFRAGLTDSSGVIASPIPVVADMTWGVVTGTPLPPVQPDPPAPEVPPGPAPLPEGYGDTPSFDASEIRERERLALGAAEAEVERQRAARSMTISEYEAWKATH